MIEKLTVSQCISSDCCKGWNDTIDEISCGCKGCEWEQYCPSHIMCHGCARLYADKYKKAESKGNI